jgi:RecB family exonuclease
VFQRRTLVRARDLAAFRAALVDLATAGRPLDARRRAVVVPTRASAELLRQTIEARCHDFGRACLLPDFVTRTELMERLARATARPAVLLSRAEREVLLERAVGAVSNRPRLGGAPFQVRPGLVSAMLDFYDELRRRQRTVRRFAHAVFGQLRGERGLDRGTDSLIQQTSFLGFAFLAYERAARDSGAMDEHRLRDVLLETQPQLPFDHLVVAVADHPSDPRGLWPADFDLIGRLRHLAHVDVVVTDGLHDAGFRERIEEELPGIEEARADGPSHKPLLRRPAGAADEDIAWVSRDREEELRDVVRTIYDRAESGERTPLERTAVVFHRPLPYLYLSQQVLAEGQVPYQAADALPLAAEPYAALLDVVLTFARTGGTRDSAIELLLGVRPGSDQGQTGVRPGSDLGLGIAALDEALRERRATGEADTFEREVAAFFADSRARRRGSADAAARAAQAAAAMRAMLLPFRKSRQPSVQIRTILDFLRRHEPAPDDDHPWRDRHLRARAAVHLALESLAAAFARHDDTPRPRADEDIASRIRHAIEAQTFTPRRGDSGVHLVDAVAARFGEFDHVHVVGLVETDWPERTRRSIFYTSGLLKSLGWPQQPDHTRVQQAVFADLLGLPARTLTLHAFQLESDSIVAPSPLLELARDVNSAPVPRPAPRLLFDDEVLTGRTIPAGIVDAPAAAWVALRQRRPDLTLPGYSGFVAARPAERYRVSRVDHYVDCPFKYFAENVLGLPEERDEMAGLTPLERGNLIHELFERFYRAWDEERGGSITAATLPEAVERFAALTDEMLARLPEADRVLERARLLGSLVAPGVAERVFQMEADEGGQVVRRLLEIELKGPFVFPLLGGLTTRTVEISGKADRIDVFHDGGLRVVDYKLSRLPDARTSIQIAVYAHAARQLLEARDKRAYSIREAKYIAFGDEERFEGGLGGRDQPPAIAVETRAGEFAGVIDRIESGAFPPQPRRISECAWCRYAGVCRKEYREGEDEAAEPV